jgi:1-acyl-sn-glycerol-3-phosphate acyltransferase
MLKARWHPWLNAAIYRLLVLPALRGGFHRVSLRQQAPQPSPDVPVLWFGNHSSWWDGYVPFALNHLAWRREGYVMVEDKQLSRYQFFRWAGGFSVDRSDARSAIASLNYASRLLIEGRNRALLIFPQGAIAANDVRPLQFFTGLGHIVKSVLREREAIALVPMALRYEFVGEQKPEAFISTGAPIVMRGEINAKSLTGDLEATLTAELDQLRDDVTRYRFDGFSTLLAGGQSINRIFDRVLGRRQIADVGR